MKKFTNWYLNLSIYRKIGWALIMGASIPLVVGVALKSTPAFWVCALMVAAGGSTVVGAHIGGK